VSNVRPLPHVRLVTAAETFQLEQKAKARMQRAVTAEFWRRYQESKQLAIEPQPETLPPYLRSKVDDDWFGPIG
jgi:hypothetical protein